MSPRSGATLNLNTNKPRFIAWSFEFNPIHKTSPILKSVLGSSQRNVSVCLTFLRASVTSTDVASWDGPGESCLRLFLFHTCWRGCLLPADVKLLNTVIVRVNDVQIPMAIDGQTVRSEKLAGFSPLVRTKAA
jgi:hypothetical protein